MLYARHRARGNYSKIYAIAWEYNMKKYRVADLQIAGRYFWEGYLFKDKEEIVDGLLDYHSIDFSGTDDKEKELDI